MSESEQKIIAYLKQVMSESGSDQDVTSQTELLGLGLLDSIGLVGLIGFIEQSFGIQLADADMAPELFETPASIAEFVDRQRA